MTSPSSPRVQQATHGQQVRVPAPVLVHAQRHAGALGGLHRGARLRGVERERLVHHDRKAELDRLQCERDVRRRRGSRWRRRPRRPLRGRRAVEGRRVRMVVRQLGAPLRERVTTPANPTPGAAASSGAWKNRPPKPYPASPMRVVVVIWPILPRWLHPRCTTRRTLWPWVEALADAACSPPNSDRPYAGDGSVIV